MNETTDHGASDTPGADNPASGSDRPFLLVAGAVFLALITWQYIEKVTHQPDLLDWQSRPEVPLQVDLNSATWVELSQLDGIGVSLAHRIVAWREAHGQFQAIDDLQRVPGIGPATVSGVRRQVVIGEGSADSQSGEQVSDD